MKVILVNGSPHQHGCTFTALDEARKTLEEEGIGTEMFWVGTKPLAGCLGCHKCAKLKHCVFDDRVNEFLAILRLEYYEMFSRFYKGSGRKFEPFRSDAEAK